MNTLQFLKSFHGEDKINFRLIGENKPINKYGTYQELENELHNYNEKGYNVYFVVNSGGTHIQDINRINAVFIDFDCGKDENKKYYPLDITEKFKNECIKKVEAFRFQPSFIIETRNGIHAYWLLNEGVNNEQYLQCQLRLIGYFNSDPAIKDLTRIMRVPNFYWTKDVNNKFMCQILEYNDIRYEVGDIMNELPICNDELNNKPSNTIIKVNKNNDYRLSNNIEIIKNGLSNLKSIELLQQQIQISRTVRKGVGYKDNTNIGVSTSYTLIPKVEFSSHYDIYDYLKKQDIQEYLGIFDRKFSCIFHKDETPSANIYQDEITGYWWYKCFSAKCPLKNAKDIIALTERLLQCNKPKALRFLRKVYNIEYIETEWQKEQKELIDENIRLLMDVDRLNEMYPKLSKRLYYYKDVLININLFAKENVFTENFTDNDNNSLFFASLKKLCDITNCKNDGRVSQRMALFAFLGLLNKLDENDIPDFLLKTAKHYASKNKQKYLVNYFSIPSYSDLVLDDAEDMAQLFEDKNMSMKGWSRELLVRTFGEDSDIVNKIYPQQKGMKLSNKSNEFSVDFSKIIMDLINLNGFATEKQVLEILQGYKELNKIKIKRVLQETIDSYLLKRIRANKEIKLKYGIVCEGYPFIIVRE